MMQENQSTLLKQARQGDAKAIASLLNQQLQPKGITAKVANQENCLQIMLEAVQLPNEKALVDFIRKGITKLGAVGIETVKVYGRQTGEEFPSWHQNIDIKNQKVEQKDDFSFQDSEIGQKDIPPVASKINQVYFYNKPSCPKNYLVPSILVSFFAVLPIGLAAIIFAAQVDNKYQKGDYDGAKSASTTAKILCIVSTAIAAPVYLLLLLIFGFAAFTPYLTNSSGKARESEARITVGAVNRAQQGFILDNNKFATEISDLDLGVSSETDNYIYKVEASEDKVITTAVAKRNNIKSYTGAVFTIKPATAYGSEDILTVTKVCQTNRPSQTAPEPPQLVGSEILCASGSSDINGLRSVN